MIPTNTKIALFLCLGLLICFPSFGQPAKKLFIVHSYEQNHVCGQPQHDGIIKALADNGWTPGRNVDLKVYYMDTKKKNNTPDLIRSQAQKVLSRIKAFGADLVITLDDNAFDVVALPLAGHGTGVVFSGMNGQPEDYNIKTRFMDNRHRPGGNITGVYEKLHIREALKVLSGMLDLKTVLILEDRSPTGKAISLQAKMELDGHHTEPVPCSIRRKNLGSWEEFQETIHQINSDPDIDAYYLGTLLLRDDRGHTHTAREIVEYAVTHAGKPAMGMNYAFIKMGLFGGATIDFYAMGYQAGKKAAAVLGGADPGTLPIEDADRVALVFNLARAETLGLKIPEDILLAADEVFRK